MPSRASEQQVRRGRQTLKAVRVLQTERAGTLSQKGLPSSPAMVRLGYTVEDATERIFKLYSCKAEGCGAQILHCQA
jgi:hypothetical protein